MELTPKQMAGLNTAIERYHNGEKYTCISGYAGSGKSTLVKFIVSALQISEEEICYTAFTGKACNVLQKKGNKNEKHSKKNYRCFGGNYHSYIIGACFCFLL